MITPYYNCSKSWPFRVGFTLAELLISLAILAIIATFTIPKVLQAQQDQRYNAMAKEGFGAISQAYNNYKSANTVTGTERGVNLTSYFNYVQYDTVSSIDKAYNDTAAEPCSGSAYRVCMRLHNGGVIETTSCGFGGTATTNAMQWRFDPDGQYDSSATGPAKSVNIYLYTNGRIVSSGNSLPNTASSCGAVVTPPPDPPWFNWN